MQRHGFSEDESYALNSFADDVNDKLIGIYIRQRGYPIEVVLHALRAKIAFDVTPCAVQMDERFKFFLPLDDNTLLQLRFLELVGKIVALQQSFVGSFKRIFEGILSRDDLSTNIPGTVYHGTRSEAVDSLSNYSTMLVHFESWHLYQGAVFEITSIVLAKLQQLVPENLHQQMSIAPLVTLEVDGDPLFYDGPAFHELQATPAIAAAIRRAEAETAILEQLERGKSAAEWLFKKELEAECQRLKRWTSEPYWIGLVKRSLAKRMESLVPVSEFSEDEWFSKSLPDRFFSSGPGVKSPS